VDASSSGGQFYAVRAGTPAEASEPGETFGFLDAYDRSNALAWSRRRQGSEFGLGRVVATPEGDAVYLNEYTENYPGNTHRIVRSAPDGSSPTTVLEEGYQWGLALWDVRAGQPLVYRVTGDASEPLKPSGVATLQRGIPAVWSFPGNEEQPAGASYQFWDAKLDADGNTVALLSVRSTFILRGKSVGAEGRTTLVVAKLDPAGKLLWTHELHATGGVGQALGLGVSELGTVVVAGEFDGSLTWAGQSYESSAGRTFVFTLDAPGTVRWFRQPEELARGTQRLAVDPAGRAFVAGSSAACPGLHVQGLNLAGEPVGSAKLACDSKLSVSQMVAFGDDLIVGGGHEGAVDFGRGLAANQEQGGFLLRLVVPRD